MPEPVKKQNVLNATAWVRSPARTAAADLLNVQPVLLPGVSTARGAPAKALLPALRAEDAENYCIIYHFNRRFPPLYQRNLFPIHCSRLLFLLKKQKNTETNRQFINI